MSQNTEENALRSRDAQEDALTYHLGGLQAKNNFRLLARAMIQEAEDRGAAEQRRKDAEWRAKVANGFGCDDAYCDPGRDNVAALEARIAELEGVLSSVREAIENADPAILGCTLWMIGSPPETVCDFIGNALTREGGV